MTGVVGSAVEDNELNKAVEFMKLGAQFTKAELALLFDRIYDLNNTSARDELIEFLDESLMKKFMKSEERQEKITNVMKLSSRSRPELKTALG